MARSEEADLPEADRFLDTLLPRQNSQFFGHDAAEQDLLAAYRTGHLPNAYLIGGAEGIGKATLAWRFARFLLCYPNPDDPRVQSAGNLYVAPEHEIARQIGSLSCGSTVLLRREWNEKTKKSFTDIRVDDVRRAQKMFQQAASGGGYRICLVDSAEDLNPSSANALLKLIEEPPPYSLFLIISHRPGRVIPTIRSRCRNLWLKSLPDEAIEKILGLEGIANGTSGIELQATIAQAKGSLHGTLMLLNGQGVDFDTELEHLLGALPKLDFASIHALTERLSARERAADYEIFLAKVFDWLSGKVHAGASLPVERLAPFADLWEKLEYSTRETEIYNLDKRPLILSLFNDLAAASRTALSDP
jgi:DNA polymerase-3 subunit delta'